MSRSHGRSTLQLTKLQALLYCCKQCERCARIILVYAGNPGSYLKHLETTFQNPTSNPWKIWKYHRVRQTRCTIFQAGYVSVCILCQWGWSFACIVSGRFGRVKDKSTPQASQEFIVARGRWFWSRSLDLSVFISEIPKRWRKKCLIYFRYFDILSYKATAGVVCHSMSWTYETFFKRWNRLT